MGFLSSMSSRSKQAKAETSAAQNKAVARNSQVKMSVRSRAAGSWFSDKFSAKSHKRNAELEAHKARATY